MITGVETRGARTTVYVDGSPRLRLRTKDWTRLNLGMEDELDADGVEDRLCALQADEAYADAMAMLASRDLSRAELTRALERKLYRQGAAESAVARLEEMHYVDDSRRADRLVEQNARKGKNALRMKLRSIGVEESVAEAALAPLDDEQQANAARDVARALASRYARYPAREARMKLAQALARRGFSWDVAIGAANGAFDGDDD